MRDRLNGITITFWILGCVFGYMCVVQDNSIQAMDEGNSMCVSEAMKARPICMNYQPSEEVSNEQN